MGSNYWVWIGEDSPPDGVYTTGVNGVGWYSFNDINHPPLGDWWFWYVTGNGDPSPVIVPPSGKRFWTGGSGNWSDPSHWGGFAPPIAGQSAYILLSNESAEVIVTMDIDVECDEIHVNNYAPFPLTLDFNEKTVSCKTIANYGSGGGVINFDISNSIINVSQWNANNVNVDAIGSLINLIFNADVGITYFCDTTGNAYHDLNLDYNGVADSTISICHYDNISFHIITVSPETNISVSLNIGNDSSIKGLVLTCANWEVTGSVANNFQIVFNSLGNPIPFIISQASGTVNVENFDLADSHAQGSAIFYALISNGNIDSGENRGWIFNEGERRISEDVNVDDNFDTNMEELSEEVRVSSNFDAGSSDKNSESADFVKKPWRPELQFQDTCLCFGYGYNQYSQTLFRKHGNKWRDWASLLCIKCRRFAKLPDGYF